MKFELEPYNRNSSDSDLIADLQRVASSLGKDSVSINEQSDQGRFNASTLIRRFGSWAKALQKAGLSQRKRHAIPQEELFEHIAELWVVLGRQPYYRDLLAKGKIGGTTYINRFGTWRNALEAFIAFVNSEESQLESSIEVRSSEPRLKKQGTREINLRLRFLVMRRDCFKCKVCGRAPATDQSVTLDVDHIKAWSKGGPTILENLQTLCTKCNIGKSDLDFHDPSSTEAHRVDQ